MTVKDLIRQDIDIDVYDDVCESLAIAFCGPMELTDEGSKHFAEVMEYEVQMQRNAVAIICVDHDTEQIWKHRLRKAKEFFKAAAGYCAADDYDKWFKEE